MKRFYHLMLNDDTSLGIAYAPKGYDLWLPKCERITDWNPFSLAISEGDFGDYQPTDLICRLCSERLRDVLDANKSQEDDLQWLPVFVQSANEERTYFILHFPNPPDILSKEHSVYSAGVVVKDVLDLEAAQNHDVFIWRGAGQLYLKVSDKVRRAIIAARCTGCEFSRQPAY